MDNDRDTVRETDIADERMRDRNVTEGTKHQGNRGEIESDEAIRSEIGAGE